MENYKTKILRFALLLVSGLIGAALAILYAVATWEQYTSAPHDSFKRMILNFQAVVIFIATIYNVGYFGMKLFKIHDQALEIRAAKRNHMLLLNGVFVFIFVMSLIFE